MGGRGAGEEGQADKRQMPGLSQRGGLRIRVQGLLGRGGYQNRTSDRSEPGGSRQKTTRQTQSQTRR